MIKLGIITTSDKGARGEREDLSGVAIKEELAKIAGEDLAYALIPDDKEVIKKKLIEFADRKQVDLIFTTGGTGLGPRDNTPDATLEVIDKIVPGITEAVRAESLKITPKAMLSRAVAGIRGETLIINLPGSVKAVKECLAVIMPALPHGIEVLKGQSSDCAR